VRFAVHAVVTTKITVFWDLTLCILVDIYQHFKEPAVHHQDQTIYQVTKHHSQMAVIFLKMSLLLENNGMEGNNLTSPTKRSSQWITETQLLCYKQQTTRTRWAHQ
jgi:hypothetical protein